MRQSAGSSNLPAYPLSDIASVSEGARHEWEDDLP
jgi:hypothetical protein